MIWKNISYQLL